MYEIARETFYKRKVIQEDDEEEEEKKKEPGSSTEVDASVQVAVVERNAMSPDSLQYETNI